MIGPAIHQFLPTFMPRDAIGTHVRHVQRLLQGMGVASDVYAERNPTQAADVKAYRSFGRARRARDSTWLLYQLSTGSVVAEFVLARPEPKIVNYHNITEPSMFAPWEPHVGVELREGRRQMQELAPVSALAIADSAFNAEELAGAGYRHTVVAPVLLDLDGSAAGADPAAMDRLHAAKARGGADWLFVGRVAPNKCQHHVVRAFAAYRRLYDPGARLHLLGYPGSHAYGTALERYIASLGLVGVVHLAGSVSHGELVAHYESADVFVCLSEHEGFCVPLVEAMLHRVPVVALAATAVPETVGDAGVLLRRKDAATVATAVHRVLADTALRHHLIASGLTRAAEYTLDRSTTRFRAAIDALLARAHS